METQGLTRVAIARALGALGVEPGMMLEVHASLSSFGFVHGGAETVIEAIRMCVGEAGSIFMPALRLSPELALTARDRALGIVSKIRVLPPDCERSAMGLIADTFRKMPDTRTGEGVFRISGWGKHAEEAVRGGLEYPLHRGGKALLLGVDIYKLTAMHYVEGLLPTEVKRIFAPGEEANRVYPPGEWFIESGRPPVRAWYTIQTMAYDRGLIRERMIGSCKAMFFDLWDVVGLYAEELRRDPLGLYGLA